MSETYTVFEVSPSLSMPTRTGIALRNKGSIPGCRRCEGCESSWSRRCPFASRSRTWPSNSSSRTISRRWWPASSGHREARSESRENPQKIERIGPIGYQGSTRIYRILMNMIIKISCNLMNFDGFQTDHGEVRFIWRLFSLPRWLYLVSLPANSRLGDSCFFHVL